MGEKERWKEIFKMHVKLLCEHAPASVTTQIKQIIKDNFYPMEACLEIVTKHNQKEAMALLYKKTGNNTEAIKIFMKLLFDNINEAELKKELYHFNQEKLRHKELFKNQIREINQKEFKKSLEENPDAETMTLLRQCIVRMLLHSSKYQVHQGLHKVWSEKFGPNIAMFDQTHSKMCKIIKKNSHEYFRDPSLWKEYLEVLFNIRFHPAMLRKSYCKQYIR